MKYINYGCERKDIGRSSRLENDSNKSKVNQLINSIKSKIFFIQNRIGKDGEIIIVYKIKTMRDGEENNIPEEVLKGNKPLQDLRVIPTRRWMRKTGFDEIPQILNILKGDMVFFGARPLTEITQNHLNDSQRSRRKKYKPGIFGGYAFYNKGKRAFIRSIRSNQDVYLRLRYKKEQEGALSLMKFHIYILVENIKAIINGVNR